MTVPTPARRAAPLVLALALAPLAAVAAPKDDVRAAATKFMAAKSFHATLDSAAPQAVHTEMDFQAPDRYRMQTPAGTQVVIGDTLYMSLNGRTMRIPMPAGTLTRWRQPSQWTTSVDGMTVTALGPDTLGGRPARKYRCDYTRPTPGSMTMWVGADGYPLQIVSTGTAGGRSITTTIRYSRFNDPSIVIAAK